MFTFYELGITSLPSKVFPWLPAGLRREKPLVDSSSASLDIVRDPLPLDRPHVLINKFEHSKYPNYEKVTGKIKEILHKIREGSPLKQADAWIRDKHYTTDRLAIERLRRPTADGPVLYQPYHRGVAQGNDAPPRGRLGGRGYSAYVLSIFTPRETDSGDAGRDGPGRIAGNLQPAHTGRHRGESQTNPDSRTRRRRQDDLI